MSTNSNRTEIDFGTRIISDRHTSKIITIPIHVFETLTQGKTRKLRIKLICEHGKKCLELTPVLGLERVVQE